MENHQRRPYLHQFWHVPLCDYCRWDDKFHLIPAAITAKDDYFLTEDDFLSLKMISETNLRYPTAYYIRYFSLVTLK
jgi:hypothetical protein